MGTTRRTRVGPSTYPDGMDIEEYRGTITPNVGLGTIPYWNGDFVLKDSTPQVKNINQAVEEAGYMDYLKVPYPFRFVYFGGIDRVVYTANRFE